MVVSPGIGWLSRLLVKIHRACVGFLNRVEDCHLRSVGVGVLWTLYTWQCHHISRACQCGVMQNTIVRCNHCMVGSLSSRNGQGTRLRNQAAQLNWDKTFGFHVWIGWVAYGGMALLFQYRCSFHCWGHPNMAGTWGPLAAEFHCWNSHYGEGHGCFGMAAAVLLGAMGYCYIHPSLLGYLLEVISIILWFGSEEYTLCCSILSAIAVAFLAIWTCRHLSWNYIKGACKLFD